jgi:hypothetical protein
MVLKRIVFFVLLSCGFMHCKQDDPAPDINLISVFIGSDEISREGTISTDQPIDRSITLVFSSPVNQSTASTAITLEKDDQEIPIDIGFLTDGSTVVIYPSGVLENSTVYTLAISDQLQGVGGSQFAATQVQFKTVSTNIRILSVAFANETTDDLNRITDVPLNLDMTINFSIPVDTESLKSAVSLSGPGVQGLQFSFSDDNKTVTIKSTADLPYLTRYGFTVSGSLKGAQNEKFTAYSSTLYTTVDLTPKFPVISDEELLTNVQEQTFNYFWDFAHPASGMARERNTSGDLVTSGGSGFGIMAIIVGIERGFITREQGVERLDRILDFLESADRFHGAWPHWINGNSGDVIPFSTNDNGGDLVETSFLIQGLLTFRQYLNGTNAEEQQLILRINQLWETVEWDWYTREGQNVLYWHWSPDAPNHWIMNMKISGYNESLITYFLSAASSTHTIDASVYHEGWARNGAMKNGKNFYDITLPLGYDFGGPLFFSHYSFMGLDPRNLQDTYANYWTQNVNHSRINYTYCVDNPKQHVSYSTDNWGLTASDNQSGYSAHSPTNDLGVITPTAALSSFPYTPEESMRALKFFYYTMGDRLWGPYGFYDAFNVTENWYANSYLAIDQGPIIVMIENHRTGLLWDLFMSAPEVQTAKTKLGFTD